MKRHRCGVIAAFVIGVIAGAGGHAKAQGVCLEPVEPYPYKVEKSDAEFYEIVRTEYESYLAEVEAYLACLSDERNRVIGRSRVILQNWIALFGDDAAIRLEPELE